MKHVRQHKSERPSPEPGSRRPSRRFALRVRVHLHRARRDRQLADGLAPDAFHDRARPSVLAWREALLGLAERLEQPVPLDPCGVARALVLLTDGGGPFYNAGADGSMSEAVWWIADGLHW